MSRENAVHPTPQITEHGFVPNCLEIFKDELVRWHWDTDPGISYTLQEAE